MCTGEDKPTPISKYKPISKQVAKIEEEEEETPQTQPKLVRAISQVTPVTQQPTPEMMRAYRNQMRTEQLKMRSDRMSSLFTTSIQIIKKEQNICSVYIYSNHEAWTDNRKSTKLL